MDWLITMQRGCVLGFNRELWVKRRGDRTRKVSVYVHSSEAKESLRLVRSSRSSRSRSLVPSNFLNTRRINAKIIAIKHRMTEKK